MSAARPSHGGSLVSPETRDRVKKFGEPIALFLGRLGLTPNGLTLLGFGITVVGAVLAGLQLWLAAGLVVFAGGVFDLFDGTLARATGRVSRLGAFMDSVFDRWGETIVYLGIVVGFENGGYGLGTILAAAAMGAAFMVSYTRARSEGLGFTEGAGMAQVGLMTREIRLIVLSLGLALAGVAGGVGSTLPGEVSGVVWLSVDQDPFTGGRLPLAIALTVIAVGATITVIQRILHVRNQAATGGEK
jgi:CDP-diacylglycerol--glycerol-3-phosphate 3-phosphatidyltransferase